MSCAPRVPGTPPGPSHGAALFLIPPTSVRCVPLPGGPPPCVPSFLPPPALEVSSARPPSFLLCLLSGSSGPALLLGKASSVQNYVVAAPMGSGDGLSPSQTRLGNHEDKPWCGGGSGWRFLRSPAEDGRKSGVAVSGPTHGDSACPNPRLPFGCLDSGSKPHLTEEKTEALEVRARKCWLGCAPRALGPPCTLCHPSREVLGTIEELRDSGVTQAEPCLLRRDPRPVL